MRHSNPCASRRLP